MKLELRENIYVRTKDGIIAKVDYIDDNTIFFDKDLYRTYGDSIDFLEKDNLERIDKAIEYLEEPNRDRFDYSKAKLLDILKEVE